MSLSVFIFGQKAFGAAAFSLCRSLGLYVAGVCAPRCLRDGRADRLWAEATDAGARLTTDATPEFVGDVGIILSAHCHVYIGPALRACARAGALGYHPSLLPLHRGRDAVRWAVHMRERVTGGTAYWLDDGVDTGDIAAQEHVLIRPDDTPFGLWERELFPLGLRLFERVLGDVAAGRTVRRQQEHALATWEPAMDVKPLRRAG